MSRARHLAVSLLAVLGLFTALGWSGASLAAPMDAPAMAHRDSCGHAIGPASRHRPMSLADEMCATCCAVLPPLARVLPAALPLLAPAQARLQPLSGIDPGLDPPPPRTA